MSWRVEIPFPFMPGEYYQVSQRFGENPQYYGQWGLPGHNGIDFACPTGTRIVSVAPGQVTQVRTDATGYGHHVRVAHTASNGRKFEAIYGHFSKNMVEPGQMVAYGTILGLSGNTGNSTGPHLHFEIRPESEAAPGTFVSGAYAVNPEPLFVAYIENKPAEVLYSVKVLPWDGLVIRSQPYVTSFNRIGVRLQGAVFDVVEETTDAQGNKWVRANSTVQQWSCWGIGSNVWLEVVSALPEPEPEPPTTPKTIEERVAALEAEARARGWTI